LKVRQDRPGIFSVTPNSHREWFEQKVAELKAELEKLPADRQEQLRRELEEEKEQ
jgi:hypothetical protein